MTARLRVVIVEDRQMDAELIAIRLEEEGFLLDWTRVETEADYLAALESGPDLVLSDWNLPHFSGLRALELMRLSGRDIPFVIVSGSVGEEAAIDALHQGAGDYVLKDRLARLGSAVVGALERKGLRDEQARTLADLRLAATVFQSSAEGVTITDPEGTILAVNAAFTTITGYDESEVVGRNPRILQSGRQNAAFYRSLWTTLLATGSWRGELWNRRKDGEIYAEWMTISAVEDESGATTHYVAVFTDLRDVKRAQQDLDFLRYHDALTGLPNRVLLLDRLGQALIRAGNAPGAVAAVIMDLDRFGDVNDALGYLVGDELLKHVSARILDHVDPGTTLARVEGDEFVVVLEQPVSSEHVASVVADLQDWIAVPFVIDGHELVITLTAGVVFSSTDDPDAATLVRHAETAMRAAKARERGSIGFFEPTLAADVEGRLALVRELRQAITRDELAVHYQPQVALDGRTLVGAEALVRWQHPTRGLLPPGVFIPLAEEFGIIGQLGEWVLREACRQVARWDAEGTHLPRVAVNLSARQLDRPDLPAIVRSALEDASLAPGRVELEVTESMTMRNAERAIAAMHELRALGVDLAMDDFGTGHSSLAQLKRLPIQRLKIDISFVRDIGQDPASEAIIRATTAMAGSLGLVTVGEGIEEQAQAAFLTEAGCDVGQGYLFGRPLPPDEFAALVGAMEGNAG